MSDPLDTKSTKPTTPPSLESSNTINNNNQDEEGEWTHVTSKSRRRGTNNKHPKHRTHPPSHSHSRSSSSTTPGLHDHASEAPRPRSAGSLRSVSDITAEYHSVRAQWETSACCLALRRIVAANVDKLTTSSSSSPPSSLSASSISQAICLGIGSFDPPDGAWEAKRRAYVQLISFFILVEEITNLTGQSIPCIFQEPIFTNADKTFLTNLGHTVVDPPQGCTIVDQQSLLFGIHLYRPIYALALQKSMPAVFIGTGWDVWDQVSMTTESKDLENLQTMDSTYKKYPFPKDTMSSTAFSSTFIYWSPSTTAVTTAITPSAPENEKQPLQASQPEDRTSSVNEQSDLVEKLKATTIS